MIPVVIPFFKNRKQLDKCLVHLRGQQTVLDIFIRDNTNDNILFTAAVNEGIKKFLDVPGWEYILTINQDMYLNPDALKEMIKFMDSHPECGIGMPLQLGGENYSSFAGGMDAFPKGVCLHGRAELYWVDKEITWASGGCLILRKKMIQEIGLLDENLRFVGSDSDYCFTARARGWQVWRISKAKGFHDHGMANTPDCGHELNTVKIDDMLYFARKWLTGGIYRELAYPGEDNSIERVNKEIVDLLLIKERIETERKVDVE